MKSVKILSLCLVIVLSSCAKDDAVDGIFGDGDLTMKINGVVWSGKIIASMVDGATEQFALSSVNVGTNETMGIVIDDYKGKGTYPIQGDNITSALFLRKDKVLFTAGKEITYVVTSESTKLGNKVAHGTFSGTMKSAKGETITIVEGKF